MSRIPGSEAGQGAVEQRASRVATARWFHGCLMLAVAVVCTPALAATRADLLLLADGQHVSASARDAAGTQVTLDMRAFNPFSADAQLLLKAADGSTRPLRNSTRFFQVSSAQDESLRGVLALPERGEVLGLLQRAGGFSWLRIGADAALQIDPVPAVERADGPFQCGNSELGNAVLQRADQLLEQSLPVPGGTPENGYTARLAIDTDTEFLALFGGDTQAATTYVGALMGFISSVYEAEVETRIDVSYLRLWQKPDPFVQTSASCMLFETGKYWNDEETDVDRTMMHFMSGRSGNGGIAWVGVLCSSAFNYPPPGGCPGIPAGVPGNYGGAYGVSSGLDGNFTAANPNVVWDVVVVAHEIGHNFNSPHTHCYAGVGGNASPVDQCFATESGASCHAGVASLPGPQGQGSGTVMSYCHLRPGGLSNISMNFGSGHPFGVATERVPSRMLAHVEARAAANPTCLATLSEQAPLVVGADPQTLEVGGTSAVTVSGGSGSGAVSLAVSAGAAFCSINGSTLTAEAVGQCEVTATKAADGVFDSATATVELTVQRADQAALEVVATPSAILVGASSVIGVEGGSGSGLVSLMLGNGAGNCGLSGDTVTGIAAGICEVTASKAADEQFNAAEASVEIVISRAPQAALLIALDPAQPVYGQTAEVSVSGGSGSGDITLALTAGSGVCELDGASLQGIGIGACEITATRAADAQFEAAAATLQLMVGRAPQTALQLLASPQAVVQGGSANLQVSGGSGDGQTSLAIGAGAALCAIDGATLVAADDAVGTCTVIATRSGGSFHLPATVSIEVGVFEPAVDLELEIRNLQQDDASAPSAADGFPPGSYRVTVTNHGPVVAPDLSLRVEQPGGLLDVLWTCNAPMPACEPPAGAGAVDVRFDLGIGETATVDLSSQLDPTQNFVEIRARVVPMPGMTPLTPDDDVQRLLEPTGEGLFRDGFE